jgi:hypothetical protein
MKDTLLTMSDIKEEMLNNSEKIIDANNTLGLPEWISILVTIIFGALAIWFYVQQKKQGKNIDTQVNRLADINRPFKDTFPNIINQIKELCEKALADPKNSEFYIMNRTSSFGKIHIYNNKFIEHYNLSNPKNDTSTRNLINKLNESEQDYLSDFEHNSEKLKYLFFEDVRTLHKEIAKCSKELDDKNFKIIVFNGNEKKPEEQMKSCLQEKFIKPYFEEVNQKSDIEKNEGLIYYTYTDQVGKTKGYINSSQLKSTDTTNENFENLKKEFEDEISEEVIKTHNDLISKIRNGKDTTDDNSWLKYDEQIPMQIYLLKRKIDGRAEYNTFVINAMSTIDKGNKERYVDGLFSTERSLYSVFKTLFDQTFEK